MHVFDVPVIVVLYYLLRPVSRSLALFATLINLVQTAMLVANKMNLLVPLLLLENSSYLAAFSSEQLHALSSLAIKAHGYGFGIGLVVPAALAFARSTKDRPDIVLTIADKRHPTLAGTYLAACTVLASIYKTNPEGNTYTAGLDAATARHLQTVAWQTVLDYQKP